jgi:predicted permease
VLLRTLPVKKPREVVFLYHPGPAQGSYSADEADGPSFSYPMFRELQEQQTPFTGIAAAAGASASLAFRNSASSGSMRVVSGNYFGVLGVQPAIGRLFNEEDDRTLGGNPVMVLSYNAWVSRFGADISVLNQTVIVNGYPMTVVGVAQKDFLSERLGSAPDVFVPITMRKEMTPGWDGFGSRKDYWVTLFARLKPGVTREQAEVAINVTYRAQLEQDVQLLSAPSATMLARFRAKRMILKPGEYGRGGLREQSRQPALLLIAMTALVLLISCANVANLQLARAAARTRETAVRLAMGASRSQLIRQLLTEACLLSIGGGVLGLGVAFVTIRGVIAALRSSSGYANVLASHLEIRTLLFCLAVSILTGLLFGLFPALQTTRPDVAPSLKDQSGQSTASGSAATFRKTLATAQVAISLLLLISAGLFGRTLLNLRNIDLGLRADHLLTFSVAPKLNRYTDLAASQFYDQLTERLAGIPGVKLVSTGMTTLLAGDDYASNITVPGYVPPTDDASDSFRDEIGAGYFRTLGIPLIAGREFTIADGAGAPNVAIVNESFVAHFLPGQNPISRRFARGGGKVTPDIEIVGVVKDSKYDGVKAGPQRVFYRPYRQNPRQGPLVFYLRTAIEPQQIASQIRREVAGLDRNLPVRSLKTMNDAIDENLFAERMLSTLTSAFALLATLLAALGLYGVLAYNVARRTREIGVRMALGAEAGHVRRLVVREVVWMLSIGTTAGLGSAAAAGKLVQNLLYGLRPWDSAVYGTAAATIWLIALRHSRQHQTVSTPRCN